MALGPELNRRQGIAIQASPTGQTLGASPSNPAIQLASALSGVSDAARSYVSGVVSRQQAEQTAKAQRDALVANGAKLADAVRDGKLEATQNPWYVQAYQRESAAVRAQSQFSQLQVESSSWDERSDPIAFQKKWGEAVGEIAKQYGTKDEIAGLRPVQAQYTQQTLQANTTQNISRIEGERKDNLTMLGATGLATRVQAQGGTITANQAFEELEPARQNWIHTGGSEAEWNRMAIGMVRTAAFQTKNASLLRLLEAPELVHGKSAVGDSYSYGDGPDDHSPHATPLSPLDPVPASAVTANPGGRLALPVQGARITGRFGDKRAGEVHNGLDLAVPLGTPVTLPGAGTVTEVGKNARSGNYVKVDLGNGMETSFAHLSEVTVKQGQAIKAGEMVAVSGSTGDSTGPHLHWVVRQDGKEIDPTTATFPPQKTTASYPIGGNMPSTAQGPDTPQLAVLAPAPPAPDTSVPAVRGPSLYDIEGVAEQSATDHYRITQAREEDATSRLRILESTRKASGLEASDRLYATHGTGLIAGQVDQQTMVRELTQAGYSGPVIAEALRNVREGLGDSVAINSARMQLYGTNPQTARQVMDLKVQGYRQGLTPGYEDKVGDLLSKGAIDAGDAADMVDRAISRTRQLTEQQRQDVTFAQGQQDHAERAQSKIRARTQLKDTSKNIAALVVTSLTAAGAKTSPKSRAEVAAQVDEAIRAHLALNPDDFTGAEQKGRDAAAALVLKFNQRKKGSTPSPAPAGGNPRRTQ